MPATLVSILDSNERDEAFITFASPEPRCLGVPRLFDGYAPKLLIAFEVSDEQNVDRKANLNKILEAGSDKSKKAVVPFKHSDPVFGMQEIAPLVAQIGTGRLTLDISTFPRDILLLFLKLVNENAPDAQVRILYTEPQGYREPRSATFGLSSLYTVRTFAAPLRAAGDLVLIILLGFEGDRALSVWQCLEPHRTIAMLPRPAYRPELEGAAERLNAALLAPLCDKDRRYVDPRDPRATYRVLHEIIHEGQFPADTNFFVVPLGTKPEVVGVYAFCRDNPEACSVIYATNKHHADAYISSGCGRVWELELPTSN
jgi:hypothetical protein